MNREALPRLEACDRRQGDRESARLIRENPSVGIGHCVARRFGRRRVDSTEVIVERGCRAIEQEVPVRLARSHERDSEILGI